MFEAPPAAFARLKDIATRRPRLVAAIGLGLLAECARVVWALLSAETVTLYGHAGGEALSVATDAVWIAGYAGWVGICGGVALSFGLRQIWRGFGARIVGVEGGSPAAPPPTVVRRR